MWSLVFSGIKELGPLWLKTKKAKAEAEVAFQHKLAQTEADWDTVAQQQAQYSWKDEFITFIWFSPLVMAWFDQDRAMAWVIWLDGMPNWWWFGTFGIMAATFGLRWYFKQQKFSVSKMRASPPE